MKIEKGIYNYTVAINIFDIYGRAEERGKYERKNIWL